MKFQIDFNRFDREEHDIHILKQLGAELTPTGSTKYPPWEVFTIELNTFEELEELLKKVDTMTNDIYSAIISFDSPTIFLDTNI